MKQTFRSFIAKPVVPVIAATLLLTGSAYAFSEHKDIAAKLGGVAGDIFDLDGAMRVNSLVVGDQSTGGVTFFNGTIVNSTTDSEGDGNPVAFGDDVRIDGDIFNAAEDSEGNGIPLKLVDDVRITGDVDLNGDLAADNIYTKTEVDASLDDKADTADVVTKAAPSWTARTGKISIPAAAFQPYQDGYDYSNTTLPLFGGALGLTLDSGTSGIFSAPVFLPNGATVTAFSMDAYDDQAGKSITAYLYRVQSASPTIMAATAATSGDASEVQTVTDSSIAEDAAVVDNDTYAYVAQVFFGGSDTSLTDFSFRRAEVTYTYTQPY